jgi:catalase (peroxidase I)
MPSDFAIKSTPGFADHARSFANDNMMWLEVFARTWVKVMNADRFDGPAVNVCNSVGLQGQASAASPPTCASQVV